MGDNAIVFIVNGICAGNLVLLFTGKIMVVWGDPNILYLYLPTQLLIVPIFIYNIIYDAFFA